MVGVATVDTMEGLGDAGCAAGGDNVVLPSLPPPQADSNAVRASTGASRAEVAMHGNPKLKKCVFINSAQITNDEEEKASMAATRNDKREPVHALKAFASGYYIFNS